MRRPGIEPGSRDWETRMLTTTPTALAMDLQNVKNFSKFFQRELALQLALQREYFEGVEVEGMPLELNSSNFIFVYTSLTIFASSNSTYSKAIIHKQDKKKKVIPISVISNLCCFLYWPLPHCCCHSADISVSLTQEKKKM